MKQAYFNDILWIRNQSNTVTSVKFDNLHTS
jgi:hypothetical protein